MMSAEAYMAKAAKECSHAAAVQAEKGDPVLCLGCAVRAAEAYAKVIREDRVERKISRNFLRQAKVAEADFEGFEQRVLERLKGTSARVVGKIQDETIIEINEEDLDTLTKILSEELPKKRCGAERGDGTSCRREAGHEGFHSSHEDDHPLEWALR